MLYLKSCRENHREPDCSNNKQRSDVRLENNQDSYNSYNNKKGNHTLFEVSNGSSFSLKQCGKVKDEPKFCQLAGLNGERSDTDPSRGSSGRHPKTRNEYQYKQDKRNKHCGSCQRTKLRIWSKKSDDKR